MTSHSMGQYGCKVSAMPTEVSELSRLGREAIKNGQLVRTSESLDISVTTLAHMIGLAPGQLHSWIKGRSRPSNRSSEKVGQWYQRVVAQLDQAAVRSADLVHVSTASQYLGASYATVIGWCEQGILRCEDLGELGLYVHRDDVASLSKKDGGR